MTLAISVHRRAPSSGELGPNLVTQPGAELAGWEVWRTTVYGSAAMRQRGAHFLPQLANANLVLEGDDLIAFKKECAILLGDVFNLACELGVSSEHLGFRLSNMAAATELAISIGGVVWIS